MQWKLTRRFWAGVTTGGASAFLLALTLVRREWIEAALHVDPDQGNGMLEWLVVSVLAVATLVCAFVVRTELGRPSHSAAPS